MWCTSVVVSFSTEAMDPESDLREVLLELFEAEITSFGSSGLDSSFKEEKVMGKL